METVRLIVVGNTSGWIFCTGSIVGLCHLIIAVRSTQTQHPSNIHIRLFLFSTARCGRSLDHLQVEDASTCYRRGRPFLVSTQDRHLVCSQRLAAVSLHPALSVFGIRAYARMCKKFNCQNEVSHLLTVLFNDVANFIHYVAYLTDE